MQQFRNHGVRYKHLTEALWENIDVTDEHEVAER